MGAGLSGLACALPLDQNGISVRIFEASDGIGGRVRTDRMDGFLLDRGFQVFLTAYPEAQHVLDYEALNFRPFYPGAMVRFGGRFNRIGDPWRHPLDGIRSLFSPIGTFTDKVRAGRLRQRVRTGSLEDLFRRPETSTIDALHALGFSEGMIDRFFRPFIGGVFLDKNLDISSRMFEFVFRMFSLDDTAVPSNGMGAIPEQLASRLPEGTVQTNARVVKVHERGVTLESGEEIRSRAVVIATEGPETERLVGEKKRSPMRGVTCLYFAFSEPPSTEPILFLDGDGKGPVINLCVPSQVAPAYAPPDMSLISATVLGCSEDTDNHLVAAVRTQLAEWFGRAVHDWRHVRTYRIRHALPMQVPPVLEPFSQSLQIHPWLFVCGDYRSVASIQWALVSGRRAADAVIESFLR